MKDNLRIYNRKMVNAYHDEAVPRTLLAARRDLVAQHVEPKSLANQMAALRDVMNIYRSEHLRLADKLAAQGKRITRVRPTEDNRLELVTQRARSTTFSGTSGNKGGRSQGL